MLKIFFALILPLAFVSCANFTKANESNVSRVHEGQSELQVTEILGQPEKKQNIEGTNVWHYDVYADDSSRFYPYTAVFKNGSLNLFYMDAARGGSNRGTSSAVHSIVKGDLRRMKEEEPLLRGAKPDDIQLPAPGY